MKLTIIDRYIARELLASFFSVFFILLLIVISTEVVHLLSWISRGAIPVSAFLSYLFNSMFEFSIILVPLCLMMGILLTYNRLYRESEMAAIMSAGLGPWQWYRPLLLVAVPMVIFFLLLLLFVSPLIAQQRAYISAEVRSQATVDSFLVGQFNRAGDGVLFLEAEEDNANVISHAFFQQHRDGENHVDLSQGNSQYYDDNGRRYMMMHNGSHYVGDAGEAGFTIIQYRDYGVHIARKQARPHLSESSKNLKQLWGSTRPEEVAELQWRFTLPLATLIVSIMALPLSQSGPRGGRYGKIALALLLYLVYSNLISVSTAWIEQEKVSVWAGFIWVHLLSLAITLYLMKRHDFFWSEPHRRGEKHVSA